MTGLALDFSWASTVADRRYKRPNFKSPIFSHQGIPVFNESSHHSCKAIANRRHGWPVSQVVGDFGGVIREPEFFPVGEFMRDELADAESTDDL